VKEDGNWYYPRGSMGSAGFGLNGLERFTTCSTFGPLPRTPTPVPAAEVRLPGFAIERGSPRVGGVT
jgi:hypothetical protein